MAIKSLIPEALGTFVLTPGTPGAAGGPGGPNPPGQGSRWALGVYGADSQYGNLLAMVPDRLWNSFTFSKMLDDQGSGTVVLAMDDPFWANQAYPNPVVPAAIGAGSVSSPATTVTFTQTAGPRGAGVGQGVLIIAFMDGTPSSASISDTAGNTWTSVVLEATTTQVQAWYSTVTHVITSSDAITLTMGTAQVAVAEAYVLPAGFTVDSVTAVNSGSGTLASITLPSVSGPGEYQLAVFGCATAQPGVPPPGTAGWSQFSSFSASNLHFSAAWTQSSTAGPVAAQSAFGASQSWVAIAFALKPGLVNNLLPNGLVPHFLLDEEHVWRVFQDGVARFDFIGETITEQLVDNSENRLVTVTGPGSIAMLSWAMAAPPGFPGVITYKTNALSDSFSEIDVNGNYVVNYGLWNASSPTADISINPAGSAQLVATGGGTVLGSTQWDATSSLFSAQVNPIVAFPTTNSAGQTVYLDPNGNVLDGSQLSQMYLQSLDSHGYYVMIGMSGSSLYAQYKGPDGTFTHIIASIPQYTSSNTSSQYNYWQISEKNGVFYFWTSADGQTWTQQWNKAREWAANPVGIYFSSQYGGTAPEKVTISGINSDVVTSSLGGATYLSEPIVPVWLQTLQAAQARNTVPWITTSASLATDSFGNPWTDTQSVQIQNGTDLYTLLQGHCQMVDADFIMEPGFRLVIGIPSATTPNEGLVTLGYDRSQQVRFYEAGNTVTKQRQRLRNQIQNLIAVINTDGVTVTSDTAASIATWGQREAWVQAAAQVSAADITVVASAAAQQNSNEILSWTLQILPWQAGRTVFRDFSVGDWVGLERPDFSAVDAVRVTGIAVSIDQDGNETHELTLVSYVQWLEQRLQYIATKMGGGFLNSNGTTQISNNAQGSTLQAPTVFNISLSQLGAGASTGGAPLVYDPASGKWIPAGSASPLTGAEVPLVVAGASGTAMLHQGGLYVSAPASGQPLNSNPLFAGGSLAGWAGTNATLSALLPAISTLAADGTFESGVSQWAGTNATIAQSSVQAHSGTFSCLATSTATSGISLKPSTAANGAPVVFGQSCRMRAWVYPNTAGETFTPAISWYTSGGAFISTTAGSPVTPTVSTWSAITFSATAVATAAFGLPNVEATVPTIGNTFYSDDIALEPAGSWPTQATGVLVTPSTAGAAAVASTSAQRAAVQAGSPYTFNALVNLAAQSNMAVSTTISWLDVNGTALSSSALSTVVPASSWVQLSHQATAPGPSYDTQVLTAAPQAWWKLSDSAGAIVAADSSGYRRNATPTSITFAQAFTPVPGNTCASFNGTTSKVVGSWFQSGFSKLSVSAWVNLNGTSQSGSPRIISDSHTDADSSGFELYFASGTGVITFALGSGSSFTTISSASGAMPATGWTHVCATWDGLNVILYVNGAVAAFSTFAGPLAAGTAAGTWIGTGHYGSGWLQGLVGEAVVTPVCLTPVQVAQLYANLAAPGIGTGAAYATLAAGPAAGVVANPVQATGLELVPTSSTGNTGTQGASAGTQAGAVVVTPAGSFYADGAGNLRVTVGVQADGTVTIVETNGPPPEIPDAPFVTATSTGITVSWNGLLNGAPPLSDFLQVQVHVSTTNGFTPSVATLQHSWTTSGTYVVNNLLPGTTYYVVLVAVNTSGNASGISAQVSVVAANVSSFALANIPGVASASMVSNANQQFNITTLLSGAIQGALALTTNDVNEVSPGIIGAVLLGSGTTEQVATLLASPFSSGEPGMAIALIGTSDSGTIPAAMVLGQISSPDLGVTITFTPVAYIAPYCFVLYGASSGQTTVTKTTGSGTIPIPGGVTTAKGECWGGASSGLAGVVQAGGHSEQYGGDGGEYAAEPSLAVTGGGTVSYAVGAGGATNTSTLGANAGSNTTLTGTSVTITAHGAPGNGTPGSGSTNAVHFVGGSAITNIGVWNGSSNFAMGGASSAGPGGTGNDAPGGQGPAGGAGALAVSGGGAGGAGANSINGSGTAAAGSAGGAPGSGGGAGGSVAAGTAGHGGAGGSGMARITYSTGAPSILVSIASASGTDPFGTSFQAGMSLVSLNELVYSGNPAAGNLIAALAKAAGSDVASNAFAAGYTGPVVAFQPGTSPLVAEVPHAATLTNSGDWTSVVALAYVLYPDNSVGLFGELNSTGIIATNRALATLPVGYRPASAVRLTANYNTGTSPVGTVLLSISTAGVITIFPSIPASSTLNIECRFRLGY